MLKPENIPDELKTLPRWVCYRLPDKTPLNPRTGGNAGSTLPGTWADYETAAEAVTRLGCTGIGFVLGGGIVGIDVDHCIDSTTGELNEVAAAVLATTKSYAELSPSGTGLHILCRGNKPGAACKNTAAGFEMYAEGRYFTVTGNVPGEARPFCEDQAALDALYRKYLKKETGAPSAQRSLPAPPALEDAELMRRAAAGRDGARFEALMAGSWQGYYKSQSEADLGLCNLLAFWFGADAARMDRVFRTSGLMRNKWDEKHGKETYGQMTIGKAVADCREVYSPPQPDAAGMDAFFAPGGAAPAGRHKRYTQDDTGNALRFADAYGERVRYSHTDKCWFVWNGACWQRDETDIVKRLADALLDGMEKELFGLHDEDTVKAFKAHLRRSRSSRGKEAMLKEAQHLDGIPVTPNMFDRHKGLLNVANGTVRLRTGEVQEHRREDYLTRIAPVEYSAGTACPMWEKFIGEITGGDAQLAHYLQVMVGYMLSGSTQEQCVFFLYGDGANGKSTFLDTLAAMLGDYAMNAQAETLMEKNRSQGGARSDIARLKGARLVTTSETDEGVFLNESLIKQLTGGDAITARFLYGKEFEFRPEFKIVMATNHKPRIRGTDTGIWRRIRLVPFTQAIPEEKQDKRLPEKLLAELPGILNWALEGCRQWVEASKSSRSGLPECKAVRTATQEYRTEQDRLTVFLDDCTYPSAGQTLQAAVFYRIYRAWAQDNGERFPVSSQRFGREMKKHFAARTTRANTEYLDIGLTHSGHKYLNWTLQPAQNRRERAKGPLWQQEKLPES